MSRRALALRGLRALKFADSLRADFPFPSVLLRPATVACNTGTAAAVKSPGYLHTHTRQPDGIDGFSRAPVSAALLLNEGANKEPGQLAGSGI